MKERRLVSLYKKDNGLWHISFAYYIEGKYIGETDCADITEDQLYELLQPVLATYLRSAI